MNSAIEMACTILCLKFLIRHVLNEYTICLNQARKLSLSVDLHSAGKQCPPTLVGEEEVKIYLRWLTHVYSTTRLLTTFISVS